MENAIKQYFDEKTYDISNYEITTHAMAQYQAKCDPTVNSLIDVSKTMRTKMGAVRKVTLNKKEREKRLSYVDEDDNIYITEKSKVITVFPNERIFVAKTMYSNKKSGNKWL